MMSRWAIGWLVVLGLGLLTLTYYIACSAPPTINDENSAATLAIVTVGAVGIERIIEGFWVIVGMTRLGNWWPLKPIGQRLDAFIDQLNKPLNKFYDQVVPWTKVASKAEDRLKPWLDSAEDYLADLRCQAKNLQQLEPGNRQARAMAARASRAVVGLEKHYPEIKASAKRANKALAGVTKFAQTFEDNPARRLMSLFAGAFLGLLVAGFLGLDALRAALGEIPSEGLAGKAYKLLPNIGTAATGLIMGLGATPTHEAIKALKEIKERRKAGAHDDV